MRKSVKDYLREVEEVYKAAATAIAEAAVTLKELRERRQSILQNHDLTYEGKNRAVAQIDEQIRGVQADIYAQRKEANEKAQAIRKKADEAFFGYYNANPNDVDMKLMKLIEAGVVSDSELMRLSENANLTMRRMIGRALEHSKEGLFVREGRLMQDRSGNPHLKAIDELIGIGDYACGGAPQSGVNAASAFLKRWDELTRPVFDKAPNVSWEMDTMKPGGGVSYSDK